MTTERERILELVAAGKLSPAEADALLQRPGGGAGAVRAWLLDPLDRLGTGRALAVGAIAVAAGIALLPLGIRYNGALDMHFLGEPAPWSRALADAAVAWPLTATVLWAVSLVAARRGRLVDLLAVVGLSRVPALVAGALLGLVGALWPPGPNGPLPGTSLPMLIAGLATIPVVVWQVVVLYRGFRTASGLRGRRCTIAAIAGIVVAEVLSKILLSLAA